jgi:hypothetical protein
LKVVPDIPVVEMIASRLVGKPQNILVVAIAFLVGYLVPWFLALGNRRRFGSLLVASIAWGVYAAWEWLVQAKTPEANIRVDLLVLWPVLPILSAWARFRAFR